MRQTFHSCCFFPVHCVHLALFSARNEPFQIHQDICLIRPLVTQNENSFLWENDEVGMKGYLFCAGGREQWSLESQAWVSGADEVNRVQSHTLNLKTALALDLVNLFTEERWIRHALYTSDVSGDELFHNTSVLSFLCKIMNFYFFYYIFILGSLSHHLISGWFDGQLSHHFIWHAFLPVASVFCQSWTPSSG